MFETLFGAEMPLAVRFFVAFLIMLGLIGAIAWAVRRFGAGRLAATTRGRQPRLAVIDYATVDGRRRLILVRRDNVEHLLIFLATGAAFSLGYACRYWLLVIALVAFAAAIELAQILVPGRHARFTDFLTDGAAACLGIGFSYLLGTLERIAFQFFGRCEKDSALTER